MPSRPPARRPEPVSELRKWLQREPLPSTIRCVYPDGEDRTVRVGSSRSRWRDAETAVGNEWVRLEALTDTGEVLRIFSDGGVEVTQAPGAPPASLAAAIATNPLMQLEGLARLLHDAHNAGAERHADAYRLAYEQQCALVAVMSERLKQLEVAWHRLLMSLQQQQPEGELDPNMQMVASLVGSALPGLLPLLMKQAPSPAPEKTQNGAG